MISIRELTGVTRRAGYNIPHRPDCLGVQIFSQAAISLLKKTTQVTRSAESSWGEVNVTIVPSRSPPNSVSVNTLEGPSGCPHFLPSPGQVTDRLGETDNVDRHDNNPINHRLSLCIHSFQQTRGLGCCFIQTLATGSAVTSGT